MIILFYFKISEIPYGAILDSCVFDNFLLADEFFRWNFETCLSVSSDLVGKLIS